MKKQHGFFVLVFIAITFILSSCKSTSNITSTVTKVNSEASLQKPYVILISLDGFRWDYVDRFEPPFLSNFIKTGVKAESLISSFPSKTFPNHYTIATGMYPENHGLIGNTFYSHKKNMMYRIRDRKAVEDGEFYGGTPIWVQASRAGMVTASYFFVGTEANIQDIKPTYYRKYDASIKNEARVQQALKWLDLPAKERPHLITLYFSDMDDIGHRFGPNADKELKETLLLLDKNLNALYNGVKSTGLPVNMLIVSDHGMANVNKDHYIAVEDIKNDDLYTTIDNGAIVFILPKNKSQTNEIVASLKQKENHFKVYKTEDTPGFEYTPKNEDWGAIQLIPDFGYYFSSKEAIATKKKKPQTSYGVHGYDPAIKEMHGIFYANGPAFKNGHTIPPTKNIHIYPLICEILGLDVPANIDGNLKAIEAALKDKTDK